MGSPNDIIFSASYCSVRLTITIHDLRSLHPQEWVNEAIVYFLSLFVVFPDNKPRSVIQFLDTASIESKHHDRRSLRRRSIQQFLGKARKSIAMFRHSEDKHISEGEAYSYHTQSLVADTHAIWQVLYPISSSKLLPLPPKLPCSSSKKVLEEYEQSLFLEPLRRQAMSSNLVCYVWCTEWLS